MNIEKAIPIIQNILHHLHTPPNRFNPDGMEIVKDTRGEYAISAMEATIKDIDNYNQNAVQCVNCGVVVSSLLVADGCPYCGNLKLTTEIDTGE